MSADERVKIQKLSTRVPGLDEILGGGLPEFSFNIIAGEPGVRLTTGRQGWPRQAEYRPDLVVIDPGMPNMDGYEACRRIRAESWG